MLVVAACIVESVAVVAAITPGVESRGLEVYKVPRCLDLSCVSLPSPWSPAGFALAVLSLNVRVADPLASFHLGTDPLYVR